MTHGTSSDRPSDPLVDAIAARVVELLRDEIAAVVDATIRQTITPTSDDDLLSSEQAAAVLGYSVHGLRRMRSEDRGPEWLTVGTRSVRYRRAAVMKWAASSEDGR